MPREVGDMARGTYETPSPTPSIPHRPKQRITQADIGGAGRALSQGIDYAATAAYLQGRG
eukprot:SAG25_NODE_2892_length_1330_cov_1.257514_1_plen_59_part_10